MAKVDPGALVLLRIINASSMSAYHVDLGHLMGELIAVDGRPVAPLKGRAFPIPVAQRRGIVVAIPRSASVHPILAVLEGASRRTGIVLATGDARIARIRSGRGRFPRPHAGLGAPAAGRQPVGAAQA